MSELYSTTISQSRVCFACNQERNRRALGYDMNTLKTYCVDDNCLNPSAIPTGDLKPLTPETLQEAISNKPMLQRMIGKAVSTRLKPYLAMHLLKTAEENGLYNVNEILLFILDRDLQRMEGKQGKQESIIKQTANQAASGVKEEFQQLWTLFQKTAMQMEATTQELKGTKEELKTLPEAFKPKPEPEPEPEHEPVIEPIAEPVAEPEEEEKEEEKEDDFSF